MKVRQLLQLFVFKFHHFFPRSIFWLFLWVDWGLLLFFLDLYLAFLALDFVWMVFFFLQTGKTLLGAHISDTHLLQSSVPDSRQTQQSLWFEEIHSNWNCSHHELPTTIPQRKYYFSFELVVSVFALKLWCPCILVFTGVHWDEGQFFFFGIFSF